MPAKRPLRLCLLCVEIFAFGKYGGFGRATRITGAALARRGVEVHAIVPLRGGQRPVERLDGMTVHGYPPHRPDRIAGIARTIDADIHHSQHPSLATAIALAARPASRHVVTCRDPKSLRDWRIELARPSLGRAQVLANWLFEDGPGVAAALRRMDGIFAASPHLVAEIARKYGLDADRIGLLPTPVRLPPEPVKAATPTVISVGRWDRRKRPERFIELARAMPAIRFVAIGRSRDPAYEAELRARAAGIANLELAGFIDQFASDALERRLAAAWVLVNTAGREGLPTAFLEALAHGCALLAEVDPGGITSRFGEAVADGDFRAGLERLLSGDAWRAKGAAGRAHVAASFELDHVVDLHLSLYERLLATKPPRRWRPSHGAGAA
jgi:glycosyltransferase involved in cell wall biosynthesis